MKNLMKLVVMLFAVVTFAACSSTTEEAKPVEETPAVEAAPVTETPAPEATPAAETPAPEAAPAAPAK